MVTRCPISVVLGPVFCQITETTRMSISGNVGQHLDHRGAAR
jgi:hypothetical protein